jgi:hypothetical protein
MRLIRGSLHQAISMLDKSLRRSDTIEEIQSRPERSDPEPASSIGIASIGARCKTGNRKYESNPSISNIVLITTPYEIFKSGDESLARCASYCIYLLACCIETNATRGNQSRANASPPEFNTIATTRRSQLPMLAISERSRYIVTMTSCTLYRRGMQHMSVTSIDVLHSLTRLGFNECTCASYSAIILDVNYVSAQSSERYS